MKIYYIVSVILDNIIELRREGFNGDIDIISDFTIETVNE